MTRPPARLRVLCLDIDTGYGGSSRSLYESLRHMDRARVAPEVWCRRENPLMARYEAEGIPARAVGPLPRVKAVPRFSRNLVTLARALRDTLRARPLLEGLAAEVNARFDLVHFNLDAALPVAYWLRRRTSRPFVMHMRGMMKNNAFARWQTRIASKVIDRFVFITENERENFCALGGTGEGEVIYNGVAADSTAEPHPAVPKDGRVKLGYLGYYAWNKGTDRLVEIAEALRARGRRDVLFVVAGRMDLQPSLPGELGQIGRRGGTLADYAARRGVADMFLFLPPTDRPESVLATLDLLVRPSRERHPWGRDLLEAMAFGVPVVTTGEYERFVSDGETGIIHRDYDAQTFAADIGRLADDAALRRRLGEAARRRVAELCDGPSRAADLLALWQACVRA